jgi:Xaa-Pro dipeptidase
MEKITFENQVKNARFFGHTDNEDPADYIVSALSELKTFK